MSTDVKEIRARTEIPVEKCNFQWTIENFSFYICKVGEQLKSPMFTNGSSFLTTWNLTMYPNGRKEDESEGKIGIYLTRTSSDTSAHFANFKLSFIGLNQVKQCAIDFEHLFDKPVSGWGSFDFIDRKALLGVRRATLLPNDTLVVCCELKTARLEDDLRYGTEGASPKSSQTATVSNLESLSKDFRALCNNETYSDLVLKIGDDNLFVHKCILSSRSCVFANMFKHNMKENLTNCLEINDSDPVVIKTMINYMYCGEIEGLNPEIATQLYPVAEKYDMQDLKKECVDFIVSHLTIENVCDVLLLGNLHTDPELTHAAKNFIYMNAYKVQKTEKWLNITIEKPDMAFALNRAIIRNREKKEKNLHYIN
ncbi:TD and POZ domain-containing protein 4 [Nephila pilipes]|uniref:TD and POZ domain-containing protein 4 n=1 Tax=Nephila pilipes TaxID=299642 RepID=A0A8X6UEC4_NEPPI|nr:TD and POZ domain-containing protein 4 [Nephila pilipes]